jgi:hypothetical protein
MCFGGFQKEEKKKKQFKHWDIIQVKEHSDLSLAWHYLVLWVWIRGVQTFSFCSQISAEGSSYLLRGWERSQGPGISLCPISNSDLTSLDLSHLEVGR